MTWMCESRIKGQQLQSYAEILIQQILPHILSHVCYTLIFLCIFSNKILNIIL